MAIVEQQLKQDSGHRKHSSNLLTDVQFPSCVVGVQPMLVRRHIHDCSHQLVIWISGWGIRYEKWNKTKEKFIESVVVFVSVKLKLIISTVEGGGGRWKLKLIFPLWKGEEVFKRWDGWWSKKQHFYGQNRWFRLIHRKYWDKNLIFLENFHRWKALTIDNRNKFAKSHEKKRLTVKTTYNLQKHSSIVYKNKRQIQIE